MPRRSLFYWLLSALVAPGLLGAGVSPYDPWVGIWILDIERSKFAEGFPKPQSQTIRVETSGETSVKFSIETVEADRNKSGIEFIAQPDGKEYPVKGSQLVDTVALTRPRPNTRTFIYKKSGETVVTNDVVLWGSALLMTITSKVAHAKQSFENVAYYRKKLQQ